MKHRNPVFIDTNGWIALLNRDDQFHVQADATVREFALVHRTLFTTDWVLAETGNGLARTPARPRFVEALNRFQDSADCRLVRINAGLFEQAVEMYQRVSDKQWGLVDCASFVVMQQEEILDALTADHHFEQAGFRCLLSTTA